MLKRADKLLSEAKRAGAEAVLLHSPENIRYFCGFTGEGCVFVSDQIRTVLTDFRYTEQAKNQAPGFDVKELSVDRFAPVAAELAHACGVRAVGFEDETLSVSQYRAVTEAFTGIGLVPLADMGVRVRRVKDPEELRLMKRAGEITDELFQYALSIVKTGMTELELVTELEYRLAKQYQSKPSFAYIVAAGENGSMPHAIPSTRKFAKGDMVTLDFGVDYMGYKSDMTRSFAIGEPGEKLREIYGIVMEAHLRAAQGLKPGAVCKAVDALAREYIREKGYGPNFGHGLGHGVGLMIHEQPVLNPKSDTVLEAGMVVTNEPGIYLPGIGGVRIEDTCIITDAGWESLFRAPKELIII